MYWDPVSGAASYNLYWSTTAGVTTANGKITNADQPVRTPVADQRHHVLLHRHRRQRHRRRPPSPEISAIAGAPYADGYLHATPGDGEVDLSWDPIQGADSYNIYWSTTQPVTTTNGKITNATSPYAHRSRTNGTTYYYIVTGVNATGEGPPSRQVSATAGAPAPPSLSATATTPGHPVLGPVLGADSYNISRPPTGSQSPPRTARSPTPPARTGRTRCRWSPTSSPTSTSSQPSTPSAKACHHRRQPSGYTHHRHHRYHRTPRRTQRSVRHAGRRPGHLVLGPGPAAPTLQHLTCPPPPGSASRTAARSATASSP